MKEPARDIKNYRTDLSAALEDTFQRRALDKFAVDYRASRERIYSGLNDRELIAEVAARKDESVRHLDELFVQFKEEAEKRVRCILPEMPPTPTASSPRSRKKTAVRWS